MECGDYDEKCERMAPGPGAVGLQLKFRGERGVLGLAGRVGRRPARPVVLEPPRDRAAGDLLSSDVPFMNEMDEISYWIHTKRAPCLMNYDNLIKKQTEEAQCSKTVGCEDAPSPRKRKKKRKLSVLDDDSVSTEKQQNIYFEVSQRQSQPLVDSCQSDSMGSDVDFNIKSTSYRDKRKRVRLQKSSRTRIHKKTKLVTSTPKNIHLRRSLRQAQQTHNNPHLNNSFEVFNNLVTNGHIKNNDDSNQKRAVKVNRSTQIVASGGQTVDNKRNNSHRSKSKNTTHPNGQFEDLSDVSGFTANYIRSTKVQSGKTPRKLRCKTSRTLIKESQASPENDKLVVCVNKSTNTGVNILNCSTDSSQNVINLISIKDNDTSGKMDKSTSLLKFMDARAKSKEGASNKQKNKNNLNVSFQSQSSGTSRYPKRYKNHSDEKMNYSEANIRTRGSKNDVEFNNSDKKENPQEAVVTRMRSRRNPNYAECPKENSVLVVSNSTEQVSSMVSMNVASSNLAQQRKRRNTRPVRVNKSIDKSGQSLRRDSLRDKSGFAACFSESDDDSVPLVQRKFFGN